jgi:hypothetical protein
VYKVIYRSQEYQQLIPYRRSIVKELRRPAFCATENAILNALLETGTWASLLAISTVLASSWASPVVQTCERISTRCMGTVNVFLSFLKHHRVRCTKGFPKDE